MLTTVLWVAFFVLLGLFLAALVAKVFVRAVRGPLPLREARRRKQRFET